MDPVLIKKGKETKTVYQVDLQGWLDDGWKIPDLADEDEGLSTTETVTGEEETGPNPTATRRAKTTKPPEPVGE